MDDLINSFGKLNISEKIIINKIIDDNNNLDDLIESFEKINISEKINKDFYNLNDYEVNNTHIITGNFKKTVNIFIDFFKILRNKERCSTYSNFIRPKWIY